MERGYFFCRGVGVGGDGGKKSDKIMSSGDIHSSEIIPLLGYFLKNYCYMKIKMSIQVLLRLISIPFSLLKLPKYNLVRQLLSSLTYESIPLFDIKNIHYFRVYWEYILDLIALKLCRQNLQKLHQFSSCIRATMFTLLF